jgi:hypothetical protein
MSFPHNHYFVLLDQGVMSVGTLLTGNINLSGIEDEIIQLMEGAAIQATWTQGLGLAGALCVQLSLIGDNDDLNWFDMPNSNITVSGASGSFGWQLDRPKFRYARLKYVGTAGSALLNIKVLRTGFSQH